MQRYIIKPLNKDYKEIFLRVTEIEAVLYPFQFEQKDKYVKSLTFVFGHIVHDVFLTACKDGEQAGWEKAKEYGGQVSKIIEECSSKHEKPPSILEYFQYLQRVTIPRGDLIALAKEFPAREIEQNHRIQIECGRYLVEISGTIDHIGPFGELCDLKSASALREKDSLPEYHFKNCGCTSVSEKLQWYWYPFLHYGPGMDVEFSYIPFVKEKTKKKEKEFVRQKVKCIVNTDEARERIKNDIVAYFRCFSYEKYINGSKVNIQPIGISDTDNSLQGLSEEYA